MDNLNCDLCLRNSYLCKNQITTLCNFIPKYNVCPICKEKTIVYEPRCHKCGYYFEMKNEE